jgi:MFS family permease
MDLRLLALLLGLVSTVNESALTPALPFLARDLEVGAAAAQGVVTAGLLGAALAYLPFTFLAGRVGAGRVYRAGLLFHALLGLLLFRASSLPAFYLLRFLQGVAAAGVVGLVPGLAAAAYAGLIPEREESAIPEGASPSAKAAFHGGLGGGAARPGDGGLLPSPPLAGKAQKAGPGGRGPQASLWGPYPK